jgi:hypothetical protein
MTTAIGFFALIYFTVMAFVYALSRKAGVPLVLPGDVYISNGTNKVYIPLGTTFIITLILFLIFYRFIPKGAAVPPETIENAL